MTALHEVPAEGGGGDVKVPDADGRVPVVLLVNGAPHRVHVRTTEVLLDVLREDLKLVGARNGCGVGMCGACTILRDGRAVSSCLTLAVLCEGADLRTIEGLRGGGGEGGEGGEGGGLSRVQRAFLEHRAFQCSYCTSGFILALEALLAVDSHPTEAAVREAFSGHLCRCGSYSRIMAAARQAAGLPSRGGLARGAVTGGVTGCAPDEEPGR